MTPFGMTYQQRMQTTMAHPLRAQSNNGFASRRFASILPEEATMNVIAHDAMGWLNVN